VTSSPEFSLLVGSKFNYDFLSAKNSANPLAPAEKIKTLNKEKVWKILDAVLSVAWKTEAYRKKPALLETLSPKQKKTYAIITSLYEEQIKAHPATTKVIVLFEKSFKYYI